MEHLASRFSPLQHFFPITHDFLAPETTSIRLQHCADIIWTGDDSFLHSLGPISRFWHLDFGSFAFGHGCRLTDAAPRLWQWQTRTSPLDAPNGAQRLTAVCAVAFTGVLVRRAAIEEHGRGRSLGRRHERYTTTASLERTRPVSAGRIAGRCITETKHTVSQTTHIAITLEYPSKIRFHNTGAIAQSATSRTARTSSTKSKTHTSGRG